MPIDVESFRNRLKQMEGDALGDLERDENEARESASAEVEDAVDLANSGEARDSSLRAADRDYERLRQVKEALERIEQGTFGKCEACGREIEPARLEAIPWTPYCLEDQEKREPAFTPPTL